mmetsp:Transcript_3119/g.9246  ORF Transcript_3119/g.9246 Transcript_3119/m.9246 type:complete len:100 (+) Transcript_3119:442-741(+)
MCIAMSMDDTSDAPEPFDPADAPEALDGPDAPHPTQSPDTSEPSGLSLESPSKFGELLLRLRSKGQSSVYPSIIMILYPKLSKTRGAMGCGLRNSRFSR